MYLERLPVDRGFLVPCSDELTLQAAELQPRLAERYPSCLPDANVLRLLVDKGAFLEAIEAHEIPHPDTRVVESAEDFDALSDEALQTAFIKPRDSQQFQREHGVKGLRLGPRTEFRSLVVRLLDEGHGLIIQQYVAGPASELPANALLLTFDDGFSDHYTTVTPLLEARGWQGRFFPCTQPLAEDRVLDVHKIHFVLASVDEPGSLLAELDAILGTELGMQRPRVGEIHRYDEPSVTAFKRLLQRDLPLEVRTSLADRFFRHYVADDERAFARELYASVDQPREMREKGMYIGCHGHSHVWFDRLEPTALDEELHRSLTFLAESGLGTEPWVVCYPYGGYQQRLASTMRKHGCRVGFLAEPGIASLAADDPLCLPRLDTNDPPQGPTPDPAKWTQLVLETA